MIPRTIAEAAAQIDQREVRAFNLDFSNNIAAGGSDTSSKASFSDGWLVATRLYASIWTATSLAGPPLCLAGTPVARWSDASPPATVGNQMPTFAHFTFDLSIVNQPVFNSAARVSNWFGTAEAPVVLFDLPIIVPPNATLAMKLYNNVSGITFPVNAQFTFAGVLLKN